MSTKYIFFILINLFTIEIIVNAWTPDNQPKLNFKYNQEYYIHRFYGNLTDYFKILDYDEKSILIGARNAVYNLSLIDLRENEKQRIVWPSAAPLLELCSLKGKSESDCQNYIRVFARLSHKQIKLCGTNAYKPVCRIYNMFQQNGDGSGTAAATGSSTTMGTPTTLAATATTSTATQTTTITANETTNNSNLDIENDTNSFEHMDEKEAKGQCPFNPTHNSTYVFSGK